MSLTVKEMNDAIQKYCVNECECVNCEIGDICLYLSGDFESDENLCKKAYDIVSKSESPEITTADLLALPTEQQDEVVYAVCDNYFECSDGCPMWDGDEMTRCNYPKGAFNGMTYSEHKEQLRDAMMKIGEDKDVMRGETIKELFEKFKNAGQVSQEAPITPTVQNDKVNHPAHYTVGGIECIDAMRAAFGDKELQIYCKIAAFKYLWRAEHKGNLTDISKAHWYLEKYLDLESESV